MGTEGPDWQSRRRAAGARPPRVALLLILLGSLLLAACGSGNAEQAHATKAKLDQELTHARADLAIPDRLLAPISAQEKKVANGDGGFSYNYDDAARQYTTLFTQLTDLEKTALATLQQQAQTDLQAFAAILNQRRGDGFAEVPAYQARFDEAQQAFTNAQKPADFAKVSEIATAQTQALTALWPAYQKLQDLHMVIKTLQDAGVSTQLSQRLYDEDLQVFRTAASADRYQTLTGVIDAQLVQVQADEATTQPYVTKVLLDGFQARIDLLALYGATADAATYQKQHDDSATQLASASKLADYVTIAGNLVKQNGAMSSTLIRAKAQYDYKQLDALAHLPSVANHMMVNKSGYDGGASYPIAYEYLDPLNGVGDAADMLAHARSDEDFQAADFRSASLQANLRAMLDNYDPATDEVDVRNDGARLNPIHQQPHKADIQLMQYYNVANGKVIVISLREQTARFYNNGKLDAFTYVTTGRPGDTSIPGFWTAINHHSPQDPSPLSPIPIPPGFGDMFTSPNPTPGSVGYYEPTPIH